MAKTAASSVRAAEAEQHVRDAQHDAQRIAARLTPNQRADVLNYHRVGMRSQGAERAALTRRHVFYPKDMGTKLTPFGELVRDALAAESEPKTPAQLDREIAAALSRGSKTVHATSRRQHSTRTHKISPVQRRLLIAASKHKHGHVIGGNPRVREKLADLKLIEVYGQHFGPLYQITAEGRAAIEGEGEHHATRSTRSGLKLTERQKTMLRMAHERSDRMPSGRGGWNEMHVRALEKKGLVTLVSSHTWNKNWKLTELGRETAKALHAAWLELYAL